MYIVTEYIWYFKLWLFDLLIMIQVAINDSILDFPLSTF